MRVSGPLAGQGHVLWIVPVCLGMLHLIEHSRTGWSRSGNISHHRRDGTRAERVGTTVRTVSEQQPPGVLYKGFRHRLVLRGCPAGSTRVSEHHAHKKQELMSSCSAVRPFCLFRHVPMCSARLFCLCSVAFRRWFMVAFPVLFFTKSVL